MMHNVQDDCGTIDHLFLHCEVIAILWARCLREVGFSLNVVTLYWFYTSACLSGFGGDKKAKVLWRYAVVAMFQSFGWKE